MFSKPNLVIFYLLGIKTFKELVILKQNDPKKANMKDINNIKKQQQQQQLEKSKKVVT